MITTVSPGVRVPRSQRTALAGLTVQPFLAGTGAAVTPVNAGFTSSATVTVAALDGPALVTRRVHVTGWPGTTGPEVRALVIDTSEIELAVPGEVAVLFAGVVSVGESTWTVLSSAPVNPAGTFAVIVTCRVWPGARSPRVQSTWLPAATVQAAPGPVAGHGGQGVVQVVAQGDRARHGGPVVEHLDEPGDRGARDHRTRRPRSC